MKAHSQHHHHHRHRHRHACGRALAVAPVCALAREPKPWAAQPVLSQSPPAASTDASNDAKGGGARPKVDPPAHFSFSGALNWLSANAFGQASAPSSKAKRGGPWDASTMYQMFLAVGSGKIQRARTRPRQDERRYKVSQALLEQQTAKEVSQVLTVSKVTLEKIASKYPQVLQMEAGDVVRRLVGLKLLLPGCDVAFLVEQQPRFFLGRQVSTVEQRVSHTMQLLQTHLRGADIAAMVIADPQLFTHDISSGLRRLREVWPEDEVDEAALGESDPSHLALAIRALSDQLPEVY